LPTASPLTVTAHVYADLYDDELDLVASALHGTTARPNSPKICPNLGPMTQLKFFPRHCLAIGKASELGF
jgi:hypothetical protein